jgi:hypothetical protein
MKMINKKTGEVLTLDEGNSKLVYSPSEALRKDLTASFICGTNNDGVLVLFIYAYKEDGTPSDLNDYICFTETKSEVIQ